MRVKKRAFKLMSIILSLVLICAVVPVSALVAQADTFVSENLLTKTGALDTTNSKPFYVNRANATVYDTTRISTEIFNATIDGDTVTHKDVNALSESDSRWLGFLYALNTATFVDSAVVFAGFSNLPDCYRVYASDSLDNLFIGDNSYGITCKGETDGIKVQLNKTVKYLAVVYSAPETTDYVGASTTNARIKEVQLWSGDETTAFKPVNLFKDTQKTTARAVSMNTSTRQISAYTGNDAKLALLMAGTQLHAHKDISQVSGSNSGFEFTFDQPYYLGDILIDAGLNDYNETYEIYASNDINTLYSEDSRVASNIQCKYAGATRVNLAKNVKYLAIFQTASEKGGMRIRQLAAYTADTTGVDIPDVFVPVNLFTANATAQGVLYDTSDDTVSFNNKYDDYGAIAATTDGDKSTHKDVAGWDATHYVGVLFTLDDNYYVGNVNITSGLVNYPDTYRVYAGTTLDDLYTSGNMVTTEFVCEYAERTLEINKTVKYIAFFFESDGGRVIELEAWSAENPNGEEFISENLLMGSKYDAKNSSGIVFYSATSTALDDSRFDGNGAFGIVRDGDTTVHKDVYAYDTTSTNWIGARYALTEAVYCERLVIYAGFDTAVDYYRVYASDDLTTLYSSSNMMAESIACDGTEKTVELKKNVKYIAVIYDNISANASNARPKEFQLWSGDPSTAPETPDTPDTPSLKGLKVLTIGNSFAQNAAQYASEIALANGKEMTFGYLFYPSCTLDMHYQAATENLAVFRFRTFYNNTGTTIKDVASSFVSSPSTSATIEEALEYADWDVIVFQQESANAKDYTTFSNLGNLINYVKGYNDTAKLMFHQVWRWGSWEADQFDLIKANSERAAIEYGLDIIPTGLAFEYAREALGSETVVNENDGNWQHASAQGQYIAGAVYTAKLFGIEISATTFASHPYVNDNGNIDVSKLTAAANLAVERYNNRGDIDSDGTVSNTDLAKVRNYVLINDPTTILADTNKDGKVNIVDVFKTKKLIG